METWEFVKLKRAIIVTEEALRESNALLSRIVKDNQEREQTTASIYPFEVRYSGTLVDGALVTFTSFDEVISYSNRGDRRLVGLSAETRPNTVNTSVTMKFGGVSEVFNATIRGEEALALQAKEGCRNVASRIRAPYGWIYHPVTVILAIVVFSLLSFNVVFRALAPGYEPVAFVPGMVLTAICLAVLALGRHVAFPRVVFTIGQEKQRNEARQYWRRWGIAAILLAVASYLATFFLRIIGNLLGP